MVSVLPAYHELAWMMHRSSRAPIEAIEDALRSAATRGNSRLTVRLREQGNETAVGIDRSSISLGIGQVLLEILFAKLGFAVVEKGHGPTTGERILELSW